MENDDFQNAPDAKPDTYETTVGEVLSVDAASGVLANDTDVEGDALSAILVSGASKGAVALAEDGSFVYTPNPIASGTDSFIYQAFDGIDLSETTTVTINLQQVNRDPLAVGDAYTAVRGETLSIDAFRGVLRNDRDPDGDAIEATVVSGPTAGTLNLETDGSFTYTPAAGTQTADSFEYLISDGRGGTDTATVTFSIETPGLGDLTLDLPERLAVGEAGIATLTYTDISPTLIAVTAERGLFADPLSGTYSKTVFLLSDGSGSEEMIEIDVRGTAGPRSRVDAVAQLADPDAITDLAARYVAYQPDFIDPAIVERIEDNITAQFGTTILSLTSGLAPFAERLESFGLDGSSATAALAFAFEAAGDFGSIEERGMTGSLGQGWATLADIGLQIDGTSVQMAGLSDIDALRALSVDAAALYTVSNSAGRSVSLAGDVLALTPPARPRFEQVRDGSFVTTSAFDGTLSETDGGYALTLSDGDALIFDAAGNFQHLEMAGGLQISASYDGDGNIVALSGPNGEEVSFDRRGDGRVTRVEDADGIAATFAYDGAGQLQAVTRPEGQSTFGYGSDGDLTTATAPGGIEAQFVYDALGRLDAARYGDGAQTEDIAYDNAGGVTITDGAGTVTELDFLPGSIVGRITDAKGGVSEIFYDDAGALAGVRAPDGTETTFEFDSRDRLTKITDANGAELRFVYDGTDEEPVSFTDAGGGIRSFTYDAGGQITEAIWPDGTELQFDYDAQGNLTGYTNRRGDDVTYTYDARGRLLSESDSSAGPTTYTYDARGRLTSATNDQGTTTLAYDSADRVTQIDYPTGRSLSYTYNEAGLRSSMSDGAGYELFYDYDALGRLTGLRDGSGDLVTYTYDAGGNLVREENGNGTVSLFDYDDTGRLTRIENRAPDGGINSFNAYTYDVAGQRVTNETQDGTWTYGYDAVGQLASADFASTNLEIDDKSITYEYDAAGNRTRVVEDGVETLYEANALNQYTSVGDATFTYDDDGNMTSRSDGDGTTTYAYDLDNRLTTVTQADGTVLTFAYDVFGNRVGKSVDGAATEFLVDPFGLGDVLSEFEGGARSATYAHGLGLAAGVIGGQTAWYDADAVGSVMTVTGSTGDVANAYAYTPFGTELREIESITNDFEFNGMFGVAEDTDNSSFMRARSYSDELGRFQSEDHLWITGSVDNLYSFSFNNPAQFLDPTGLESRIERYSRQKQLEAIAKKQSFFPIDQPPKYDSAFERAYDFVEGGLQAGIGYGLNKLGSGLKKFPGGQIPGLLSQTLGFAIRSEGRQKLTDAINNEDFEDVPASIVALDIYNQMRDGGEDGREKPEVPEDPDAPAGPPIPDDEAENPNPNAEVFGPPAPSDTDSAPVDPADGDTRTYGDPHLITFDRTGYSFQAVGEFTMVLGDGFEMQVRMEAINDFASVNTAVAMQVGDDIVAAYARETIPLVANGTAVVLAQGESIAVGGFTLYRTPRGAADDLANAEYIVTDSAGNGFYVRVFNGNANILPFVSDDAPVAGILGNLDGDRSNDFALRDGTVLTQPLPQTVLYGEYADSWRIDGANSLFLYRDGESTETFTDRSFPAGIVTYDDLDPVARAEAEAIAEAAGLVPGTFVFETTVIDIVLTGNSDFAEAIGEVPEFAPEDEQDEPIIPVEVNEAPELPDEPGVTVGPDGSFDIDALAGVTDPEGDTLTLLGGTDANGGTVEIVEVDGRQVVRFTPADGFSGDTEVSFQIGDGQGNVVTGSVTVTVDGDGGGVPLVAADDSLSTDEDKALTASLFADNGAGPDQDADGDTFSITTASIAGIPLAIGTSNALTDGGTLQIDADGTLTFDPGADFQSLGVAESVTLEFDYTISNAGGSDSATVTLTITGNNDAPVAAEDSGAGFSTDEDTTFTTASVLGNDTDVDGDTLNVSALDTTGTLGLVTDNGDGTFNYDPNGAFESLGIGDSATDSFTYTASDGNGGTDKATVSIMINPVNDAPATTADMFSVSVNGVLVIPVADLLVNDSDVDGDALLLTGVSGAVNGTVVLDDKGDEDTSNDEVVFTPDAGYFGDAEFDYTIADGFGGNATGRVDVTVTDAPNVAPTADPIDAGAVGEDGAVVSIDLLTDASAADSDGGTLGVANVAVKDANDNAVVFGLAGALLTINPTQFAVALNTGDNLTLNISYNVTDGQGGVTPNTGTLVVAGLDGPFTWYLDGDADGFGVDDAATNQLAYEIPEGTAAVAGDADDADDTVYPGAPEINDGKDNDQDGLLDEDNRNPVADSEAFEVVQDGSLVIPVAALLDGDTDPDGDALTVTAVSGAVNGTVALDDKGDSDAANDEVTFTPTAGFFGDAFFDYEISDGFGGSDTATTLVAVKELKNVITGTAASDYLVGTQAADVIYSDAGSYDRMIGGGGADEFVFGQETRNGIRERDVIMDYEVGIDSIVLINGASVGEIRQTSSSVVVFLDGDNDAIYVRGDGVTDQNLDIFTEAEFYFG
nr:Ig-like domain-containing protein [Marinobacterium profundum]